MHNNKHSFIDNKNISNPHIAQRVRSLIKNGSIDETKFPQWMLNMSHAIKKRDVQNITNELKPTMEIAFFVDESFFNTFSNIFGNDRKQIREMLEAFLNGVQALFHYPSIGTPIDMIITEIYYIPKKSKVLGHFKNYDQLLNAFCTFQEQINYPDDTHPKHWDIAVLITSMNATEKSKLAAENIGGIAYLNSICSKRACAVVDYHRNPISVIAHEIGHV